MENGCGSIGTIEYISISANLNARLGELAARACVTIAELLRRTFVLVDLASIAKQEGNRLAVTNSSYEMLSEIVGI